jgi:hypothetical protein
MNKANAGWLSAGLVGGFAAGFLACLAFANAGPTNVTDLKLKLVAPGGAQIELDSTGEGVDYKDVLEHMFAHDLFRPGVVGWLAEQHRMYPVESETVVSAIKTKLCPGDPPTDWVERVQWRQECASKPTVSGLRELADQRQVPFHYIGIVGSMGVPSAPHQPAEGRANVCREGPLHGKRVQVQNPVNGQLVHVEALGYYFCVSDGFPTIQLNPSDAGALFPDRPLQRLEQVVIVPL